MIHADLNPFNFVVQRGRVGVIDFDDCGWGYHLYDVAVMLCALHHHVQDSRRRLELRDAYLDGYTGMRPFPSGAENLLAAFVAFREMTILKFILESPNPNVHRWGPRRVNEALHWIERYLEGGALEG